MNLYFEVILNHIIELATSVDQFYQLFVAKILGYFSSQESWPKELGTLIRTLGRQLTFCHQMHTLPDREVNEWSKGYRNQQAFFIRWKQTHLACICFDDCFPLRSLVLPTLAFSNRCLFLTQLCVNDVLSSFVSYWLPSGVCFPFITP